MHAIADFKLERYFAQYEFSVKYLLSPSDCESIPMAELVRLADAETSALWENLTLGYTESQGHPLLCAAITQLYERISAKQVVVAAPEELIFVAMHSLLHPGDHLIYTAPAYQSLYEVARAMGCTVTPWHLQQQGDGWWLDLAELKAKITSQTRLLIVNFPHNPSGYLATRAELAAIVEIARRHNLYLFSDEMYRLLEFDPALRLPAVCDLYERGISLSGLSKAFGLPGLRIGWLATQVAGLPARWLALKDYTTICNSAPSEILGIIALRAAELLTARNRSIVAENLRATAAFMQQHAPLFQWLAPQAGSTAFPRWLGEMPIEKLCCRALDERGLMIVPGHLFDYTGNHFRVGLGRRNLPDVLAQFDALLH